MIKVIKDHGIKRQSNNLVEYKVNFVNRHFLASKSRMLIQLIYQRALKKKFLKKVLKKQSQKNQTCKNTKG